MIAGVRGEPALPGEDQAVWRVDSPGSMRKRGIIATTWVYGAVWWIAVAAAGTSAWGYELTLAENGTTQYRIVVGTDATPQVRAVARDFAEHFEAITGVPISIDIDQSERTEREILIGPSRHLEELVKAIQWDDLDGEQYLIFTRDHSLVLTGGKTRGVPNAVYTFLDEILGCRWYAPDCAVIPKKPTLKLKALHWQRAPTFKRRCVFLANASRPLWAARMRLNGFVPEVRCANHGETTRWEEVRDHPLLAASWFPACTSVNNYFHTLRTGALLTSADARAHPEFFALIDGSRNPGAQICYTNPDLVSFIAQRARMWLEINPNARYISISQADTDLICQCESCKAAASRFTYTQHRTPTGSLTRPDYKVSSHAQTGLLMTFVNAVARRIAKDYPDILVHTFSYNNTLFVPNEVVVEPNVIVEYACLSACYFHTFATCAYNEGLQPFWSDLQRWSNRADHVWVWWYDIYLPIFHPVAMLGHWRENLLEWRDVGVEGVTIQANQLGGYLDQQWMQQLRAYVYAKTLWDPTRDVWELAEEFCDAYYGAAAQPMLAYIRQTQDPASYQGTGARHCARRPGFHQAATPTNFIQPAAVRRWQKLLDAAEEMADDDPKILKRIAVDRLSVDLPAMIYLPLDDPARKRAHKRFFETAPELCTVLRKMEFWLSYSESFDTLEEAARELAASPPRNLEEKADSPHFPDETELPTAD